LCAEVRRLELSGAGRLGERRVFPLLRREQIPRVQRLGAGVLPAGLTDGRPCGSDRRRRGATTT
jgi:hypothetical protein